MLGKFIIYNRDGSVQLDLARFHRSAKFREQLSAWRRIRLGLRR